MPINGATGSSYSLSSAQSGNAGSYTVVISNVMGSVTSAPAMLTVTASNGGGGGGTSSGSGGGGAPSTWFCIALFLVVAIRTIQRRTKGEGHAGSAFACDA
jgi:hypothetical protein